YPFLLEKGKQWIAVNIARGGQIPQLFVGVVQVRLGQGEQLLLQGNRFPKVLRPIDRLRTPPPIPRRSPRNRYQRRNSRATTANASRPNGCAERLRASSAIPRISRFRCAQHSCMRPEW